jgi:hypothetical protein
MDFEWRKGHLGTCRRLCSANIACALLISVWTISYLLLLTMSGTLFVFLWFCSYLFWHYPCSCLTYKHRVRCSTDNSPNVVLLSHAHFSLSIIGEKHYNWKRRFFNIFLIQLNLKTAKWAQYHLNKQTSVYGSYPKTYKSKVKINFHQPLMSFSYKQMCRDLCRFNEFNERITISQKTSQSGYQFGWAV